MPEEVFQPLMQYATGDLTCYNKVSLNRGLYVEAAFNRVVIA